MKFEIEIVGDELNELTDCVVEINQEDTPTQITRTQFLQNICMNYLTPRVRNVLVHEAKFGDLEELKGKLGNIKALKKKHKGRK